MRYLAPALLLFPMRLVPSYDHDRIRVSGGGGQEHEFGWRHDYELT